MNDNDTVPTTMTIYEPPENTNEEVDEIKVGYKARFKEIMEQRRISAQKLKQKAKPARFRQTGAFLIGLAVLVACSLVVAIVFLTKTRFSSKTTFNDKNETNELSDNIVPLSYAIRLSFKGLSTAILGSVHIVIKVNLGVRYISVDCGDEINVRNVRIISSDGEIPAQYTRAGHQTILLYSNDVVNPGLYQLMFEFRTETTKNVAIERAFSGSEVVALISQTDGVTSPRHILPCLDNPQIRTTNSLEINVPNGITYEAFTGEKDTYLGAWLNFAILKKSNVLDIVDSKFERVFKKATNEFAQRKLAQQIMSPIYLNASLFKYASNRVSLLISDSYIKRLSDREMSEVACISAEISAGLISVVRGDCDQNLIIHLLASAYFNCIVHVTHSENSEDNMSIEQFQNSQRLQFIRNVIHTDGNRKFYSVRTKP
ncbi:hypothetical protein ACOME3_005421 [Neoechinorhynchus agilis]